MKERQRQAAIQSMILWLEHPQELGKHPAAIKCTEVFELHEMHYYIFKYKKSLLGKWLLGVCGGFEGDELIHCGHVFSKMEDYVPSTAKEKSIEIIEFIRAYWIRQATEIQLKNNRP